MSEFAMAEQLANYRRSFRAIGLAFLSASYRLDDADRPRAVRELERALAVKEGQADAIPVNVALICMIGLLGAKQRQTPREVVDGLWKSAPTDDQWRSMIDAALDRREEDE